MPDFTCELSQPPAPLPHFWEHTVGSGHALLALRADWQAQLARCHRELGMQHVRFHGLLSDDVGTLVCEQAQLVYSFYNADRIMDFLLSIGMRPFVELSFMPSTLSSGDTIVFHYRGNVTPPRDYGEWALLVRKLVAHWIERYGAHEVRQWFFEVWNEPNLKAFWTGTQQDYFTLYRHTAEAIKSVDAALRVGGPASAMNAWIPEFLDFCERERVPVDFVSTHHYPTDAFGSPGDDTLTQLAKSRRSVLRAEAAQARGQARGKPLYYTEWSTSSNPFDALHDEAYAAAFVVKTVLEAAGLVEGYSYWTFSDIFEENYFSSVPFHGGFGLLNLQGVPKPAYRAYELLHRLGTERLAVAGEHATVDAWAARAGRRVQVVLTNWALPRHPLAGEQVHLALAHAFRPAAVYLERIDAEHANPRRAWQALGAPEYPSPWQVDALEAAAALVREPLPWHYGDDGRLQLDLFLPPNSVAALSVEPEGEA